MSKNNRSARRKGLLKLCAALAAVSFVWLVVLPAMAEKPAMADYIRWLDDQNIDPSAMYYTELEMMEPLLEELAAKTN